MNYLCEFFEVNFNYNENGIKRNWKGLGESEIEQIFIVNQKLCLQKINFIKDIKLQVVNINGNDQIEGEVALMDSEQIRKLKQKLGERMNQQLENAYSVKYNRSSLDKIPLPFWIILFYFMHDNILNWIRNPLILFLLMVLCVLFGYLVATGKSYIIKEVFYLLVRLLK